MRKHVITRVLLALSLALAVSACGGDAVESTTTPPDTDGFPVVVRDTEIPALPQRIVSLSATHTEVLYEIGAGDAVVGTDAFSDYPPAAADTEKIDAFNLSVEAVSALDPDLVVLAYDPGDAMSGFAELGIPAILFPPPGPATLDEVYREWHDLGIATGHTASAGALVDQVSAEVTGIVDQVPQTLRAFRYYVELDSTLFSAGPGTLLDSIFGMLGLENIAPVDGGPYPQFTPEYILSTDPDFIFLADTVCCGQSLETVMARPGWNKLSAVGNGNVVELDDSIVSRWSHRILDLVSTVFNEVYGTE